MMLTVDGPWTTICCFLSGFKVPLHHLGGCEDTALSPSSGLVELWCVIMAANGGREGAGLQRPRPGCDQASSFWLRGK